MTEAGYYLDSFLAPLAQWLYAPGVTDIWINRPGEVWTETAGGRIERHEAPLLDEAILAHLARQIASHSAQGISRAHPLLAASLPDGARVQVIAPPATRGGHILAIRRQVVSALTLADWDQEGAFQALVASGRAPERQRQWRSIGPKDAAVFLRDAVQARRNIIVAGGTATGKTTFLNSLLAEISTAERIVTIEDTPELELRQPNIVGLVAARGDLAEASVDAEDMLIAALRLRPDRIILGELRGREAFTFLRAVNTGHPGSMTTLHADSPQRAIEQLALLVLQAGTRLSRDDVAHYVQQSIDIFVQLERREGRRLVSEVLVAETASP
ncbi:MAG: P-type DNA transfer ATPase VirB11 [Citromicrobium sp.]|nr:MAG: P-type DNA transfer ATPase VirB11 [Citromicrobium sp.]